jgi:hypothetical protein
MITGETVFIVAAYAGVGVGTLGLIGSTLWDSLKTRRRLRALDVRGSSRRGGGR